MGIFYHTHGGFLSVLSILIFFMRITHSEENTHPLLQHCTEPVVAAVFALACLVVWGLALPMTLTAYAESLPPGEQMIPKMVSTSPRYEDRRLGGPGQAGMDKPRQNAVGEKAQAEIKKLQMFRTVAEQRLAKQRVQGLAQNLTQFQKQLTLLQKQGVAVPSTLSANIEAVLKDIKTMSESVAASKIGTPDKKPMTPRPMGPPTNTESGVPAAQPTEAAAPL